MLLDRNSEREVLDRLLDGARAGQSGALVMRGEPGVGKTALLQYAVDAAPELTVLHAVGCESESELAFAALHQFCAPMLARLDALPGPQRDALAITFGMSAGEPPDQFLVALAVLSLLSETAEQRPLLCVIDDVQWLDRASARPLGFVARRLQAEPVAMLFAAREPDEDLVGLPELEIEGLDDADAHDVLASVIRWPLDERVRDQIVVETRGNPLALLELPRGLSSAQLAAGAGLLGVKSTSGRIEESFVRRLREQPDETQRWLLVASADATGDPALLVRAADRLALARDSFAPAETAGLVEVGATVRFRHPLVRSAIYGAAAPEERRLAHRALADATDADVDPDRRAWHLAEATATVDDEVAAELERSAGRAQARGGFAAAAAFLERAAALTSDPGQRAQRALVAAQAKYAAGAFNDALDLLATAEAGALSESRRPDAHRVRAQIAFASGRNSEAPTLLLTAARELEAVDHGRARATYLEALQAALFAGRLARDSGVAEIIDAALAGPRPPESPGPSDLLLQGMATQFTEGYAAAAPILFEATSAFCREVDLLPEDARWRSMATFAAANLWDDEAWRLLSGRELELARATGNLTALPIVLSQVGYMNAISGDLTTAEALLDEIRAATEATEIPHQPYVALWVLALRGREAELVEVVEAAASDASARGEGFLLGITAQVTAALNNALGRYDVALAAVREAVDVEPSDELGSPRTMPELIEAAVRCGEDPVARRALDRLAESTAASGTDWGLGLEARCRALLSAEEGAERLYREAIERLGRTRIRVQLARTHLLYGEWLRRARRRLDAREQLRAALEMFMSMGAEAFAGRAEHELRATGERVRRRTVETRDELTAQEAKIARLASEGLSNSEIGARLFISPHTVAYHLRKIFSKLGISSRNQLGGVLPGERDAAATA